MHTYSHIHETHGSSTHALLSFALLFSPVFVMLCFFILTLSRANARSHHAPVTFTRSLTRNPYSHPHNTFTFAITLTLTLQVTLTFALTLILTPHTHTRICT